MFAIVKISGKQYKVENGSLIDVDRLDGKEGESITLTDVLLTVNDSKIEIGTPFVSKAKITATILKQVRGEKIEVSRYKHKVRYRRHIGFRPELTTLKITNIS